jgi:hypothetical protein
MQSKLDSLLESITNILIGFTVATISNLIVLPMFGYNVTPEDSIVIAVVFTVISLVRSYVIRRVFNKLKIFK